MNGHPAEAMRFVRKMNAPLSLLLVASAGALSLAACSGPETISDYNQTSQGTLVANTRPPSGGADGGSASEMAGDREGIMRKGGKLYYVKDRGLTQLSGRQRVTPGLYLESSGEVSFTDGRRMPVREGTMITGTGEVIQIPPYLR